MKCKNSWLKLLKIFYFFFKLGLPNSNQLNKEKVLANQINTL